MSPSPNSPNQNIVFFDGECVICNGFFQFLLKRDKQNKLQFGTLQSEATKSFVFKNTNKEIPSDSLLVWHNNKLHIKSSAALHAISTLGGPWKLVKAFFIFPPFLRNIVYNFIAKNRYKWWQKTECMVPDHALKSRFID